MIHSLTNVAHKALEQCAFTILTKVSFDVQNNDGQEVLFASACVVLLLIIIDHRYAESKLGVESLVKKWESEGWANYISLAAAVIGWTRSKLMQQNNIVAPGIEALGCRTFSTREMVLNFVGLFHPEMTTLAAEEPLWADLTGNWTAVPNMTDATNQIRARLREESQLMRARIAEDAKQQATAAAATAAAAPLSKAVLTHNQPLASPRKMAPPFPALPATKPRLGLEGMVNLRNVVVVVGCVERCVCACVCPCVCVCTCVRSMHSFFL
jgi:fatty acid synthase subunit alpha